MKNTPVYFSTPEDEMSAIDPYEEFIPEVVEDTSLFDISTSDVVSIAIDVAKGDIEDIGDVIDRTGDTLLKPLTSLTGLDEVIQSDMVTGLVNNVSVAKDFFYDKDGIRHSKAASLIQGKIVNILSTVDGVFGKLCVNGVEDTDFDTAYGGSVMTDVIQKGLLSLAKCLLAKITEIGLGNIIKDLIISRAASMMLANTPIKINWMISNIDPRLGLLVNDTVLYNAIGKYAKPPSLVSLSSGLSEMTSSFSSLKDDWFKVPIPLPLPIGLPFISEEIPEESNYRSMEVMSRMNEDSKELFSSSEDFYESLAVIDTYTEETEFNNYL